MNYELSPDNLRNLPRPSIPDWFEKELKRIVGKNDYGKPMVRLVWGPDETRIAFGKVRKKYLAMVVKKMIYWEERTDKGTSIYHPPNKTSPENLPVSSIVIPVYESYDIAKPRFFLEEYWYPELTMPSWEEHRYSWENGVRVDVLGPAPTEGMYRTFRVLETEDGKYREPNESDLAEIRQLLQMREAEKKEYGNREVQNDKAAIAATVQEFNELYTKDRNKSFDKFEEELKEKIRPRVDRLVKNPGKLW
jgi:hypothetical protein